MSGKFLPALCFVALVLAAYAAGLLLRRLTDRIRTKEKKPRARHKAVDLSRFGGNYSGGAGILLAQISAEPEEEKEDPRKA